MEEKKVKRSLLDIAKKAETKKETSATKARITLKGKSQKLIRLKEARGAAKDLEAEIAMIEGELKPLINDAFIDTYIQEKKRPESFLIVGDEGGEMLVIVQDKYLKVDENKAAKLEVYDELLECKRTFTLDTAMLEKYEDEITEAIMSMDIPEDDKLNIISVKIEKCVKKGSIERLMQYKDPKMIYALIQPVLMLK